MAPLWFLFPPDLSLFGVLSQSNDPWFTLESYFVGVRVLELLKVESFNPDMERSLCTKVEGSLRTPSLISFNEMSCFKSNAFKPILPKI